MSNPDPVQTDAFKATQFKRQKPYTLAEKPVSLKLPASPVDVRSLVASLPKDEIRAILAQGLFQRGLLSAEQVRALGMEIPECYDL